MVVIQVEENGCLCPGVLNSIELVFKNLGIVPSVCWSSMVTKLPRVRWILCDPSLHGFACRDVRYQDDERIHDGSGSLNHACIRLH